MELWLCQGCNHIAFNEAPDHCPVCGAPKDMFTHNNEAINPAEKEGKEKHVPVIVQLDHCGLVPDVCKDVHIKVGSTPHPMVEDHWIQWIDAYVDQRFACRTTFRPEAMQAAVGLHVKKETKGKLTVIEFCNKHGHWTAEAELA